jgi:signal transduction histidine kinase
MSARDGVAIEVSGPSERLPISTGDEEHLYRLGQEALANAIKHARATRIAVAVTNDGSSVGLEVRDDGHGFDAEATYPGHLGLTTMHSRASEIGAKLGIDSAPASGTLVRVELPLGSSDAQT